MLSQPGTRAPDGAIERRAAIHAALGEPTRLAIVEDLVVSDRSPRELAQRLGVGSNLLAHHVDMLVAVGLVTRAPSSGDARRKYISLERSVLDEITLGERIPAGEMLFVCTRNSARSQLAAAVWAARTGRPAKSAGTDPADRVHRGAVAAARRRGLSLGDATPRALGSIPARVQVVTVCDMVHEELTPHDEWWHWSIPDPVERGDAAAFDAVVDQLEERVATVVRGMQRQQGDGK